MDSSNDIFNFSSTNANESSVMSKEEFVNEIIPKVQAILNKVFPNTPAKRKIKVYKDRISFAAPCCGDSASNNYKKRGNIIIEGKFQNMYKCFNCGTFMSIPDFFKAYGQDLSLSEIDYILQNKVDFSSYVKAVNDNAISYIYDTELINQYTISRDTLKSMLGLIECTENSFIKSYLYNRKQYDMSKFLYSERVNKLFILNLTNTGNIFGIQIRSFNKGDAKYRTYNLQKLHEVILQDNVVIPDDINTLSMLFNVLLIDCTKPVTVVEGPMDSFLIKNCIALCGAAKTLELPFMVRYLFDDDKAGRQHAIDKIKEGYPVFLWDKFKSDMCLDKRKKWDVNDVYIWCGEKGKTFPLIDNYFSDDELDMIEI